MAVVFDKDLTFRQRIAQYNKESLKIMAENLGLRKLSKLRKAELVELIAERFLDPRVFFYRAAILNDKEIALVEKGSNGPADVSDRDSDLVCRLNEMDLTACSQSKYLIPCDVVEAFRKIRTPEFEAYRKRASWVWMCVKFAEHFYGYTPIKNMLDLVNCKKGFKMTEQELIDIFDHFPEEHLWTLRIGDIFLDMSYADDMEELKALRTIQANKEFYIPSVPEVVEFYETDALISDKPYQELIRFLEREFGLESVEAADIVYELWDLIYSNDDPHENLHWLLDQFEFENEEQFKKMTSLYIAASNGTRRITNRGYKPEEMPLKTIFDPDHLPTIRAGSANAAKMLSQMAPEIQKMGFVLDLDSNAGRMPVMGFPEGINGQVAVSEKKIYPNDPCPCGSGKKYKKCCGR